MSVEINEMNFPSERFRTFVSQLEKVVGGGGISAKTWAVIFK